MDTNGFLEKQRLSEFYENQIAHIQKTPAHPAEYADLDTPLAPALQHALQRQEIRRLYAHQKRAIEAALHGNNVVVVTSTASGKTLCYNIPVLNSILSLPKTRALYLFPTRALTQNQIDKLEDFALFPAVRYGAYDGDTSLQDRQHVKKLAHIVLTNPDMLHLGILPAHSSWAAFFQNLQYIVLDELHTYRGVFGTHISQIMRRLLRICALYGSTPQFLCCSATIANPLEHARLLTGVEEMHLVEGNGAPAGPRTFVFWNPPPLENDLGGRRSANTEAAALFTDLTRHRIRSIAFARTKRSAELILRTTRENLLYSAPQMAEQIASYRSGYTVAQRREIERALFCGELTGIVSTSALELGIDIGSVDAVLLTGYPGSVAATWQQAGRSGRSGQESMAMLIARDNPLDQFLIRHPEYFFSRSCEHAIIDPNNLRILQAHLLCAAYERPIAREDLQRFGPNTSAALQTLREQGKLTPRNNRLIYSYTGFPAKEVNIRTAACEVFTILQEESNSLLGTMEGDMAFLMLHPGAIYLHMGESYLVTQLDTASRTALVRLADVNYYTEAAEHASVQILSTIAQSQLGGASAAFGEVVVQTRVVSYTRHSYSGKQKKDIIPLEMPEQTFETEALWLALSADTVRALQRDGHDLSGSLHALEHAAAAMMPLLAFCDRWDIGGMSHPVHPDTLLPTLFLYDSYPGGVGLAESAFQRLPQLLKTALALISECPCTAGCPSCIHSALCGLHNTPLDKQGARKLLQILLQQT